MHKILLTWTDGKALIATGVPYSPIELKGVTYDIGQANNALIYPGVGLGVLAVNATRLSGCYGFPQQLMPYKVL